MVEINDSLPMEGFFESVLNVLDSEPPFKQKVAVVLDVGGRALGIKEVERLLDLFFGHGIYPKTIRSSANVTIEAVKKLGFKEMSENIKLAKIIGGMVRSGDVLEAENSVVLFGDVNPGGSVVSGQNVIVLGNLRGNVWAGKGIGPGSSAFIFAMNFSPLQVRIGSIVARSEDSNNIKTRKKMVPEIARIEEGSIHVREYLGEYRAWPNVC